MPGVLELAEAIADALRNVSPELRMSVEPHYVAYPAADAFIEVFPANPAESNTSFGPESRMHWFTIRMRVSGDSEGAQDFLYNARDPVGPSSVREALLADGTTLSDLVEGLQIDGNSPTGFIPYADASGVLQWVGQEWRVGVMVGEDGLT